MNLCKAPDPLCLTLETSEFKEQLQWFFEGTENLMAPKNYGTRMRTKISIMDLAVEIENATE